MPIEGVRCDRCCSSRLNPTTRVLNGGWRWGVGELHVYRVSLTSHMTTTEQNNDTSTSNHAMQELALWWLTILPGWVITRVGPSQPCLVHQGTFRNCQK